MAQQNPPIQQFEFGGIVTNGHPLRRDPSTASACRNLRIMPGNYLRLRAGRKYRSALAAGSVVKRFQDLRLVQNNDYYTTSDHFFAYEQGGNGYWSRLALNDTSYATTKVIQMDATNWRAGSYPAICTARDRVVFFNGAGYIDGSTGESRPALAQYKCYTVGGPVVMGYRYYFGLDANVAGGNPTVATSGTGTNRILYSRKFYVGLYNQTTGHFSNGIYVGKASSSDPGNAYWTGTVTINGLQFIKAPRYKGFTDSVGAETDTDEASALQYVFYATLDGGATPYMILNADGTGPLTAPCFTLAFPPAFPGSTTKSLSLVSNPDPDGFLLDVTQEMPTKNHPPRPMSSLCYANGRLYGCLQPNSNSGLYGKYTIAYKDLSAVVWSSAADDYQDRDFVGVPEESWPPGNKKYTPNGERPVIVAAAMDRSMMPGGQVLVITHTGTFLLSETSDGLHTWNTVSASSGVWDIRSFTETQYGYCWLDQRKQMVMLPNGSADLQVLSAPYPSLTLNASATGAIAADYLYDARSQVDRYQLWLGDGTSICHDFAMQTAYTTDNQLVDAAATMMDTSGRQHHILSIGRNLFTQDAQPEDGSMVTTDATGSSTSVEINGEWAGQWQDFGDSDIRKEIREIDFIGDGYTSTQLNDRPVLISYFADLDGTEYPLRNLHKIDQSSTDHAFRVKVSSGNRKWFKLRVQISGHSQQAATYSDPAAAVPSPYGTIYAIRFAVSTAGQNR